MIFCGQFVSVHTMCTLFSVLQMSTSVSNVLAERCKTKAELLETVQGRPMRGNWLEIRDLKGLRRNIFSSIFRPPAPHQTSVTIPVVPVLTGLQKSWNPMTIEWIQGYMLVAELGVAWGIHPKKLMEFKFCQLLGILEKNTQISYFVSNYATLSHNLLDCQD